MTMLISAPPPHSTVEDYFDRADGPLGDDWLTYNIAGNQAAVVPNIFSNGIRQGPASSLNTMAMSFGVYSRQMLMSDSMRVAGLCVTSSGNTLVGGVLVRCSLDGENFVGGFANSSAATIQTRIGGGALTVRSTTSGNQIAVGDLLYLECTGNLYQLRRVRSGTDTLLAGWNDSGNLFTPSIDRRFMGFCGSSLVNFSATRTYSIAMSELIGYDLAA